MPMPDISCCVGIICAVEFPFPGANSLSVSHICIDNLNAQWTFCVCVGGGYFQVSVHSGILYVLESVIMGFTKSACSTDDAVIPSLRCSGV